jgi:Flp pilus assembly protein TadB
VSTLSSLAGSRRSVEGRLKIEEPPIGDTSPVIWVYVFLAILIAIAIWLAIVVVKWLLILAVVVGAAWLILLLRRRFAH